MEDSDQYACVDTCEDVSVERPVHDQIYKQCASLRCRYSENPIRDLVRQQCVDKCALGEFLLEEALVC